MLPSKTESSAAALIKIAITSIDVLSACYMPFLARKGVFIPSGQLRGLGDRVFLVLRLGPDQKFAAGGAQVCWITPPHSSDGQVSGFGLHFDKENSELAQTIESCLAQVDIHNRAGSHTL
jgi:type IV pilus assembly protein PilZ